ncbi:hypothetical protein CVT25_007221 [Psilocybe cyanescens]|uniref:Uncharacterized protein n=1 Tax=Psilocybe cyanescens TaxID=93625 RepID=A0A409X6X8_PSICY|nr:hypothetical protein CVT25_007221 [Psilocybe cyanescens]
MLMMFFFILHLACECSIIPDISPACTLLATGYSTSAFSAFCQSASSAASAALATARGSGAGLSPVPFAVPASISMGVGGKEKEAVTEGPRMSTMLSPPPVATTSTLSGAEQEQPMSVGTTATTSASSSTVPATAHSTTFMQPISTTTASDNDTPVLPGTIIQDLHLRLVGHLDRGSPARGDDA